MVLADMTKITILSSLFFPPIKCIQILQGAAGPEGTQSLVEK